MCRISSPGLAWTTIQLPRGVYGYNFEVHDDVYQFLFFPDSLRSTERDDNNNNN